MEYYVQNKEKIRQQQKGYFENNKLKITNYEKNCRKKKKFS